MLYKINLPNLLTLIRLFSSLFILPFLIVYFLPLNIFLINFFIIFLFILLSITDFLDGYLARKYNLETKFGRALDPIADKFFLSSTLISLLAINFIPAAASKHLYEKEKQLLLALKFLC